MYVLKNDFHKAGIMVYVLIIALFYVTGGAFSYTNFQLQLIAFLVIIGIYAIAKGYTRRITNNALGAFIVMSIFALIVPIFNSDSVTTYLGVIIQLLIGLLVAASIDPVIFRKVYVKVILFFATASLAFFLIGMIAPNVAFVFPYIEGEASVDYYNAFIYVFMQPKGYSHFLLTTRNAGICWEPGCYQSFLNIALLFLLDGWKNGEIEPSFKKLLVLVVTIITTGSTTGFVLLALILLYYRKVWRVSNKRGVLIPIVILAVIMFMLFRTSIGIDFMQKITREITASGDEQDFFNRISLKYLSLYFRDGIWFFGMSFKRLVEFQQKYRSELGGMWNSVIQSLLCLGTPFTIMHLIGYYKGSKVMTHSKVLLFIVMIACASAETLFWRVFFNTIAFYGWIGERPYDEQ